MRTIKLIFILTVCYVSIALAQNEDPSFISSSPTAAELGKFGQVPVGLFTGTASFSIPLYELKTQNLSLPVSLNYSSNGFIVTKLSSWVGFDWSLSSGGVITRIPKGIPDDIARNNTTFPVDVEALIGNGGNYSQSEIDIIVAHFLAYDADEDDYEPDLYSFNFLGNSGMFYIGNSGSVHTIPYQNVEISYDPVNEIFEIIATDGVKYSFKGLENSRNTNAEGYYAGKSSYVTYYLTSVNHPIGDEIQLYYSSPIQYTYTSGISHTDTHVPTIFGADCQYETGIYPLPEALRTEVYQVLLDSIVAIGYGKLIINRSTDWLGVHGGRLSRIDYRDTDNELINSTELNHVFPSTTSYAGGLPAGVTRSTTRLFLASVVVNDKNGVNIKRHSFEYENLSGLPVRLTYSRDHWGYFNGKGNSSLIPDVVPIDKKQYFPGIVWANRNPNYNYAKRGMLKKITYPTGGYTEIEYEAHKQFETTEVGGVRVAKTTTYPESGADPTIKKYEYSGGVIGTDMYTSYYSEYKVSHDAGIFDVYKVTTHTNFNMGRYGGGHIGYPKVTIKSGLNGENGSEEHQFSISFDTPSYEVDGTEYGSIRLLGSNNLNPPPFSNTGWNNGEKQREIYYTSNSKKVREIIYSYTNDPANETTNYVATIRKTGVSTLISGVSNCGIPWLVPDYVQRDLILNWVFDAWSYSLTSKWRYLSSKTETVWDGNQQNGVTSTTNFYYDNPAHALLMRESIEDSDGDVVVKKVYYPEDYTSTDFTNLINNNIVGFPIDVRTYRNSQLISGNQTKYNAIGQAITSYNAEVPNGDTDISFNASTPYTFTEKVNYTFSATSKNLYSINKENDITITYLWSYVNTLPVAKIVNATFAEVSSALSNLGGSTFISNLESTSMQSTIDTKLTQLRNEVVSDLPYAFLTTYTHKPLIGMTRQTDPAGITTYFEYDDFGRLESVNDHNEDMVKAYDYHYTPAPELTASPTSLSFPHAGDTETINVTSNISWTVSDNQSWITTSPSSGSDNGTISVTTTSNSSSARSGTVTISENDGSGVADQTISISQDAYAPTLTVSPTSLMFPGTATRYITITSDVSWNVSITYYDSSGWLSVSQTSGSGNATISVTSTNANASYPWEAQIDIYGSGIYREVDCIKYY